MSEFVRASRLYTSRVGRPSPIQPSKRATTLENIPGDGREFVTRDHDRYHVTVRIHGQ